MIYWEYMLTVAVLCGFVALGYWWGRDDGYRRSQADRENADRVRHGC